MDTERWALFQSIQTSTVIILPSTENQLDFVSEPALFMDGEFFACKQT